MLSLNYDLSCPFLIISRLVAPTANISPPVAKELVSF